jgi:DNA adenine methylase
MNQTTQENPTEIFTPLNISPRAKMKPLIKWVGGKRWLVPLVTEGIAKKLNVSGGRYIEPFLGGGALAFDLGRPNAILADSCEPLISMYRTVRDSYYKIFPSLTALVQKGMDTDSYYEIRGLEFEDSAMRAAQFIYLNVLGYNGMYRVNSKGEFNIPYGDRGLKGDEKIFPNLKRLEEAANVLSKSNLLVQDFRETISEAKEGDVVFADPPYAKTFTGYSKTGFSQEDQEDLAIHLYEAEQRGVTILATNSDCPEITGFYEWCETKKTSEPRFISRDWDGRKPSTCLLICNDWGIVDL